MDHRSADRFAGKGCATIAETDDVSDPPFTPKPASTVD
jgi:hypothetical protein